MDDKNEYEYGVDHVSRHLKQGPQLISFRDSLEEFFKEQGKCVDVFVPYAWGGTSIIIRVASTFKKAVDFLDLEGVIDPTDDIAYPKWFTDTTTKVGFRQRMSFTYLGNWTDEQFAQVVQFCKDNL